MIVSAYAFLSQCLQYLETSVWCKVCKQDLEVFRLSLCLPKEQVKNYFGDGKSLNRHTSSLWVLIQSLAVEGNRSLAEGTAYQGASNSVCLTLLPLSFY